MGLTKQQLEALNSSSFPDNTSELITPQILRDYNSASIQNTVNQDAYTTDSASFDSRINAITSSVINTGSFATTGSNTFIGQQTMEGNIYFTGSNGVVFNGGATINGNPNSPLSLYFNGGEIALSGSSTLIQDVRMQDGEILFANSSPNKLQLGKSDNGQGFDFVVTGSSTQQQVWFIENQGGVWGNTFFNRTTIDGGFTASLQEGYAWVGNSSNKNSQVPTSSFGGGSINTGSFATTGSNTFNGLQIISASGNGAIIYDTGVGNNAQIGGNVSRFPQLYTTQLFPQNINSDNGSNINVVLTAGGGVNGGAFKVNAVSGSQFTGSIGVSGSIDITGQFLINGIPISGSNISGFATTGSNTFTGQQTISNNNLRYDTTGSFSTNGIEFVNSKIYQNNFLNFETQGNVGVDFSANNATDSAVNINFRNTNPNGAIQFTTNNGGYIKIDASTGGGNVNISGSQITLNNVDFIPFSSSVDSRINAISASISGSGGTTYTNPSLNPYSGSLVLVANTFTSSSFAHISASANGQVNLVFKNNNNTGTTILSGSNNIFTNPGAPSAGFVRYIGGSENLILTANAVPQITASAQFSPAFNSNIINSNNTNFFMRAPVSASGTWTIRNNYLGGSTINIGTGASPNPGINTFNFTNNVMAGGGVTFTAPINLANNTGFSNNYINGTLTLNLNSSSVAMAFCNVNDSSFTINNNAYDSSTGGGAGTGSLSLNRLNIGGSGNLITARNAGTMSSYSDNVIFGAGNSIAIDLSQTNNAFNGTQIMGKNLIVTASGVFPDSNGQYVGSMFVGRNNAVDGNKALTAQTIFAVGTGTSTSARKTGFLIDSGSNTFIEGTLNVSGSTTMTGSLLISSSATYDLIITGAARVVSQDGLQTNTIGPNTFNIDTTRDASVNAENYIFGSTGSVSSIYVGVYDDPNFTTDVELKISADSGGISFNDWDNVDGAYENWLTLAANVGNNPIPKFTRGLNVSGSTTLSGSLYIQSGSTLPSSTGSSILTYNAATGQVSQAPFSTIVSASVSSAEFWSTTTQSGSAGVSGSLIFNNSGSFYNVSLVNNSQLQVANAGVYNIQFSAQIETSAGADTVYLWFKKNGTNIGDSASKAVLANNTAQIMTVNILDEAAANDYYEIAYQTLNGNATILAEAASGNIPAIPSVIATIIQIR